MDWLKTMAWVFRGRGWVLAGFLALVVLVYAHVPLATPDQPLVGTAYQASAR